MTDWETYQAAYQAADEETKNILHSSLIPECVAKSVTKFELDATHSRSLIQIFSAVTLKLMDKTAALTTMREAGIPAAEVIYSEITNQIATQKPTIADTSLADETPAEATPLATQASPSDLATDIAEAEAALKAIPTIRTMGHDAEQSHTGSSQADLLNTSNRWNQNN